MKEQMEAIRRIAKAAPGRIIISKPSDRAASYRRIVVEKKESYYQAASYTEKQVSTRTFSWRPWGDISLTLFAAAICR